MKIKEYFYSEWNMSWIRTEKENFLKVLNDHQGIIECEISKEDGTGYYEEKILGYYVEELGKQPNFVWPVQGITGDVFLDSYGDWDAMWYERKIPYTEEKNREPYEGTIYWKKYAKRKYGWSPIIYTKGHKTKGYISAEERRNIVKEYTDIIQSSDLYNQWNYIKIKVTKMMKSLKYTDHEIYLELINIFLCGKKEHYNKYNFDGTEK